MAKTKNGKTMLLLMIVLLLITVIAAVIILSLESSKPDVNDLPDNQGTVLPNETTQDDMIQVDLVEYEVYDLEEVDFRFVIAKVRVKANKATNISLDHFTTSEGIVLSEVDEYVSLLESKSLFLGKQNVWFELISSEENYLVKLFVPVLDKHIDSFSLNSDFEHIEQMYFDLSDPQGTREQLGYIADDIISDGKTYQMKVSEASLISDEFTRTYEDGYSEAYLLPSTAEIHAFKVEVVSLWADEVEIEEAWYQTDDGGELFEALNGQFTTVKYDNIINSTITDSQNGYIFFVTLNPEDSPLEYHGTLQLKLKGAEHMIHIQVNLQ